MDQMLHSIYKVHETGNEGRGDRLNSLGILNAKGGTIRSTTNQWLPLRKVVGYKVTTSQVLLTSFKVAAIQPRNAFYQSYMGDSD